MAGFLLGPKVEYAGIFFHHKNAVTKNLALGFPIACGMNIYSHTFLGYNKSICRYY